MSARRILVGLVGANILKSLSPPLHEDAFSAAGIRGHYHLMDLDRLQGCRLEQLFGAIKTAGMVGGGGMMDVIGQIKDGDSKIMLDGYCKFEGKLTKK